MTTKLAPVVGFEPRTFIAAVQTKLPNALVEVASRTLTVIHVVDGVVELGSDGSTGEGRRGRHVGRRRRQGGRRSRWSRLTLGQMNRLLY